MHRWQADPSDRKYETGASSAQIRSLLGTAAMSCCTYHLLTLLQSSWHLQSGCWEPYLATNVRMYSCSNRMPAKLTGHITLLLTLGSSQQWWHSACGQAGLFSWPAHYYTARCCRGPGLPLQQQVVLTCRRGACTFVVYDSVAFKVANPAC